MKQETIDNFCSQCSQVNECGFTIRGLQYKCPQIQTLEDGYDLGYKEAVNKACEWLEENLVKETTIIACGSASINFENVIKQFKKAMQ